MQHSNAEDFHGQSGFSDREQRPHALERFIVSGTHTFRNGADGGMYYSFSTTEQEQEQGARARRHWPDRTRFCSLILLMLLL